MDIHTVNSDTFSVEDVVKAHMEDLAVQEKFSVTQLKYWVNEEAKTIFCLMKGPDKEACHQVHAQSHGQTACNIIEVSDNEYNLFMGMGTDINDLAHTQSGDLDTGYRTIMLANIVYLFGNESHNIDKVYPFINQYNGVPVLQPGSELISSFVYASDAIKCTKAIKKSLGSMQKKVEYNFAIVSGKPVDEQGDTFFEKTKIKARSLGMLGLSNKIYLDKEAQRLSEKEVHSQKEEPENFTIVRDEDMKLIIELSEILVDKLIDSDFNSKDLITLLGISKSQVYRKIKLLTDMAPNQLLQEARLQKALLSLTSSQTIAEIAYESGFNSPSYFTRAFKKRFGILPTDFVGEKHVN
ncbi:MAG: nickel-binding protein [Candidatus Paceibacterota bacterium]